jgi:arylsulfatase A-like enzyme
VLDTLRFDATALDPESLCQTPFLARFSASGVNFTNCYSTHDSTTPSHAALFSGFLNAYNTALDQPEASIAHQLRSIGYHTFAVVANGNLSPRSFPMMIPFEDGVNFGDLWMELDDAQKEAASRSFDGHIRRFGTEPNDSYRQFLWSTAPRLLPHVRARLERARQPFLGFVNLIDCHDPYIAERRYYSPERERRLRKGSLAPPRFRRLPAELANPDSIADPARREFVKGKIRQAQGRAWSVALDLGEAELAIYRMRYNAAAHQVDDAIASIVEMLEVNGLLASTILMITSDHGESFGEADLLTHSFNEQGDRESTHRVPMLIVFPPCFRRQGVTISEPCTLADVTPTLYDLVGIDATGIWRLAPAGETGKSLLPLLKLEAAPRIANASADPAQWTPISAERRTQMGNEALKRLRALGYVK